MSYPWWLLAAFAILALVLTLAGVRRAAHAWLRHHPARVGRWGDVLPGYPRTSAERCASCRTPFAYAPAHGFRYEGRNEAGQPVPVTIAALCVFCNEELSKVEKAAVYLAAWEWLQSEGERYDRREPDAIRAAVAVGL